MTAQHLRPRPLVAATMLALLISPSAALPAVAAPAIVTEGWEITDPAVAVRSDGVTVIAYRRSGTDPGILVMDDDGGPWASSRATTGEDGPPDLALDTDGAVHLAFVRWDGAPQVHHVTNASGSWVAEPLPTAPFAGRPALAIAPSGAVHIVYPAEGSKPGLYHLTNASGSWVSTFLPSRIHDWEPDIAIDGDGHVTIVFARYAPESTGIYHLTDASGTWVSTRVTTALDDDPSLVLDGSRKPHVVYVRYGSTGTVGYSTNAGGTWSSVATVASSGSSDLWFSRTSAAFDSSGRLHAAADLDGDIFWGNPVWHLVRDGGAWGTGDHPLWPAVREDDTPAIAFTPDGGLRLAFARRWPAAGIELYTSGDTSTQIVSASHDAGPSADFTTGGEARVAFGRYGASGSIRLATDAPAWPSEAAGTAGDRPARTDVAAHTDGSVRIVSGTMLATNESGSWKTLTPLGNLYAQSAVAVGTTGLTHIITGDGGPGEQGYLSYRRVTDAVEYAWPCGPSVTCVGGEPLFDGVMYGPPQPDIALNAAGTPYVAAIDSYCLALFRRNTTADWTRIEPISGHVCGDSAREQWPSIAIDGTGKIHIAYWKSASEDSPGPSGIRYVTNASGSWVSRIISRSGADGPPSLVIDSTNHAHIAFRRGYWAATPGLYLATNASGTWVTRLADPDWSLGDPSLASGPNGAVGLVYAEGASGIRLADAISAAATASTARDIQVPHGPSGAAPGRSGVMDPARQPGSPSSAEGGQRTGG